MSIAVLYVVQGFAVCSQARIQRVAETLASWFECASFIWHVDADLAINYA